MINGVHAIIYSKNPDADRSFFREVLEFPHVDAGGGWLIFGLPPAELAIHPADDNNIHELFLMSDDIDRIRARLTVRNIPCSEVKSMSWGRLIRITLPGGGNLGIYEPRHPRAADPE